MAISGVGTRFSQSSSGRTTLDVTPTTIGDLLAFTAYIPGGQSVSSLSGGGVASWSKIVGPLNPSGTNRVELWMGVVTATGASTVTVTPTGALGSNFCDYTAQQFTAGSPSLWAVDGSQTGTIINGTSTTIQFPTLTPGGIERLYLGFGFAGFFGALSTGQTSGYTAQVTSAGHSLLYNANVPNSAQSPIATQSSSTSGAVAALIVATPAATPSAPPRRNRYRHLLVR